MIYDYKIKDANNNEVSMADYKGKVLLIVNTATGCGFTPQYEGLQKLYDKYKAEGFEILDFPCNQFFEQAPGSNEEIVSFCQLTYGTTFNTFGKVDVNGENEEPLYTYLKVQAPTAKVDDAAAGLYKMLEERGFTTKDTEIKWNFTKFLVAQDGTVIARFAPTTTPEVIEAEIKQLLNR